MNYIDAAASYEKVIALETVADEYKDAADKAKECYFNQAEKLYGEKKYTEAAEYYTKAGDYTGAAEKVKECSYMNGETLAEQKKYDEAVKAYETAGDYKDAADKIKECYYNNASDKMEAKEYAAAKETRPATCGRGRRPISPRRTSSTSSAICWISRSATCWTSSREPARSAMSSHRAERGA